jgi:hypothetical protein
VTVYGDVPPEGSRRHLGVCGVCRQQMKLGGGGGGDRKGGNKSSKSLPLLSWYIVESSR